MVDIYTALDVHTTETIAEGRRRLKEFSNLLQVPLSIAQVYSY